MLLTGESDVRDGQAFLLQCFDHHFGLVRQDYLIIESLEENHWTRKTVSEMNRRAFVIQVTPLRIGTHEPLQVRSEEHTSELQSQSNLVCRLLLEKKKR